jgi:hypothetical protein
METTGEHRPDLRTELIAGVTTFFTMAYIVVINPSILSTEGTGMPFTGALKLSLLPAVAAVLFRRGAFRLTARGIVDRRAERTYNPARQVRDTSRPPTALA